MNITGPLFDADNHYWEASAAFTRHREPKFRDRGLQVKRVDGVSRYVINGKVMEVLPGPADVHPRTEPGAFLGLFGARVKAADRSDYFIVAPADHSEWYNRDSRLAVMDAQGMDACWMFPSQGVVVEPPMQATGDIEASDATTRAFNRWFDDDCGFGYKNRIFAAPTSRCRTRTRRLPSSNGRWRGARVVNVRHRPAMTRDGARSAAHLMFGRFWGLVQEAGIVVACHGSADRSYDGIHTSLTDMYGETPDGSIMPRNRMSLISGSIFEAMMKGRQVHDFGFVLIAHRLFERSRSCASPSSRPARHGWRLCSRRSNISIMAATMRPTRASSSWSISG